jgi:protein involved in polysaccharide export with SLBB domain
LKIIVVLVCLLAGGMGGIAAQEQPLGFVPLFRAGDAVRVSVWQYPELSGTFDIADDGTVVHPIYQSVNLLSVTQEQAEAAFRTILQRYETEPQFVVEPLYRITIMGEVRSPNVYTVSAQSTVLQAIAQAGGVTPLARVNHVRVTRAGREMAVDLSDRTGTQQQLRLQPGDQIMVDSRRSFWSRTAQPTLSALGSVASLVFLGMRIHRSW